MSVVSIKYMTIFLLILITKILLLIRTALLSFTYRLNFRI